MKLQKVLVIPACLLLLVFTAVACGDDEQQCEKITDALIQCGAFQQGDREAVVKSCATSKNKAERDASERCVDEHPFDCEGLLMCE